MTSIMEFTSEIEAYLAEKYPEKWLNWESFPKALMYIVTECAEAMEDWRDDNKGAAGEELADIAIRLFHTASALGVNLDEEIKLKMEINKNRPIHHGRKRI